MQTHNVISDFFFGVKELKLSQNGVLQNISGRVQSASQSKTTLIMKIKFWIMISKINFKEFFN